MTETLTICTNRAGIICEKSYRIGKKIFRLHILNLYCLLEQKIFDLLDTPWLECSVRKMQSNRKRYEWGNEIYFIVLNPLYHPPEKYEWLQEHFEFVDLRKAVFFCSEKHLINVDVLIDDCFANIENRAMHQIGILYDQPWNHLNNFVNRAKGWEGVMAILEEFGARNGH